MVRCIPARCVDRIPTETQYRYTYRHANHVMSPYCPPYNTVPVLVHFPLDTAAPRSIANRPYPHAIAWASNSNERTNIRLNWCCNICKGNKKTMKIYNIHSCFCFAILFIFIFLIVYFIVIFIQRNIANKIIDDVHRPNLLADILALWCSLIHVLNVLLHFLFSSTAIWTQSPKSQGYQQSVRIRLVYFSSLLKI